MTLDIQGQFGLVYSWYFGLRRTLQTVTFTSILYNVHTEDFVTKDYYPSGP